MKKLDDRSIEEQINKRIKSKKANTVFLRLLSKQKSKHKDWSDVRTETYNPDAKSNPRNEMEI